MSDRVILREDIQALRGIAVLFVLLFHAKIGGLSAGYLGVDIFFVLSGYLITGLVARRLREERFSFAEFYLSRAKRLLPAAYVVYVASAIAAFWFLTDSEFDRFLKTLWGALSFTANINLWFDTDYFGSAAKFNLLLHVWSLSIEEQFYFILPLALFLTPRRYWLGLVILVGAASLVLCFYLAPRSPVATFYLLPTRAWELALGSVVALAVQHSAVKRVTFLRGAWIGISALAILFLVPIFAPGSHLGSVHPGIDAILVCVATALLLISRLPLLAHGPLSWLLARFGDISYSLYLIHWPLFALAANAYLGETPPLTTRMLLLLVSIALAVVLYRFVEDPIRRRPIGHSSLRAMLTFLAATGIVVVVAIGIRQIRPPVDAMLSERPANFGLSAQCEFEREFQPLDACTTHATASTLVWGDSFAMHLVPGLVDHAPEGIVQATKSACGPIVGLAAYRPTIGFLEEWARNCVAFNRSVMEYLSHQPHIELVVLSSPFSQYVEDNATGLINFSGRLEVKKLDYSLVVAKFESTIIQIEALGKRVVVVGPTPTEGFDIGLCHERRLGGMVTLGSHRSCDVQPVIAESFRSRTTSLLNDVSAATGVTVINLSDFLCDESSCTTIMDGMPLYRDAGHFSNLGSKKFMEETSVAAAIFGQSK